MHKTLQPLIDRVSTLEFEEFGRIGVNAVSWVGNDMIVTLSVEQQDCGDEVWLMRCSAVRESRLTYERAFSNIRVETCHPVLLPHTAPVQALYFRGVCGDPDRAVGQLVEAHRAVFDDWCDCYRFVNTGSAGSLTGMLRGGFGKIAEGPQPLIKRYADVLRTNGLAVSSPAPRPPRWWDGTAFIEDVETLNALILEKSFIVSAEITAEKN